MSSSFAELGDERRALQQHAFRPLQRDCAERGWAFQAIDLRWGVSPQAALDQQTMQICLDEIERCRELSPHLNFLALLGGRRRGWIPLPTALPATEFDAALARLTPTDRRLVEHWYLLDRNGAPPVRRLRHRDHPFDQTEIWNNVEDELLRILTSHVPGVAGLSAVEHEVAAGILDVPDPGGAFAVVRENEASLSCRGGEERYVRELEHQLRNRLPADRLVSYDRADQDAEIRQQRLMALADDVRARFATVIKSVIDAQTTPHSRWPRPGSPVPAPPSGVGDEVVDRDDELAEIDRYLDQPAAGVLAVVGPAGTGKSTLLSAAASAAAADPRAGVVVIRLLGTTPATARVEGLLRGLVAELSARLGDVDVAVPVDVRQLIGRFGDLLNRAAAAQPIRLFLDAVDQLAPDRGAHELAWLPYPLPPHVHVVLSTLPGTSDDDLARRGARILQIRPLTVEPGRFLVRRWLARTGRTLTAEQEALLLRRFASEGRPLWLRLAVEVARTWRSDSAPTDLPPDLKGLIRHIFGRLAKARGRLLVGHTLGFLAASGAGLSEPELLAALSQDPEVMAEIAARSHPDWRREITSVPVVVWAQLRADLQPYLTERDIDGELLIGFYHRALAEVAATDGLARPADLDRHRQLADVFRDRADPSGTGTWRGGSPRALARLLYHLHAARSWESLVALLGDTDFLERTAADVDRAVTIDDQGRRRVRHGGNAALHTHLTTLLTDPAARLPSGARSALEALERALRLENDTLATRPQLWWQQVANRLRWDRAPAARAFIERETERRGDRSPWLELQSPPPATPALLQVLHAHQRLSSCAISVDATLLLTGGQEGAAALWHAATGEWLAELSGHSAQVRDCKFGRDASMIYTIDSSGTLRRWQWDGVRVTLHAQRTLPGPPALSLAVADGYVAVAGPGGLRLCDPENLAVTEVLEPREAVRSCAVGGSMLVAGYVDGSIRAWSGTVADAMRESPAGRTVAHEGCVYGCAVTASGDAILTGGQDGRLLRWDRDLQPIAAPMTPRLRSTVGIWACAADARHERSIAALAGGVLQLWDAQTGRPDGLLSGHAGDIAAVAMSPDGRLAVSAGLDGTARLWDPTAGSAPSDEPFSALLHTLAFRSDGRAVVTVDMYGIGRIRDLTTASPDVVFNASEQMCMDADVSVDGNHLAVVDSGGALLVWDIRNQPRLLAQHPHDRAAVCRLIGGRAAVSGSVDGSVIAWDVNTGAHLWTFGLRQGLPAFAVDEHRSLLLVGSASGEVVLLDGISGHPLRHLRDGGSAVASCTFGYGGVLAAGTAVGDVLTWVRSGREVVQTRREALGRHEGRVLHLAKGSVEYPVVSGSADHTVGLWPAAGDAEVTWLKGHDEPVRQVLYSPHNGLITSAGDDRTLRVWTAAGDPVALLPIEGHGQLLTADAAGRLIACGDSGGFTYMTRLRGAIGSWPVKP